MDMGAGYALGVSVSLPAAPGELDTKERRALLWAMRRNPASWSGPQTTAMHWLQRANLKSARTWRLKMGLRQVYGHAREHNDAQIAAADLKRWIGWARRSQLDAFKRLGKTLRTHFEAVARGMLEHRSNAFVEAMNGLLQQVKRAARGFRNVSTFNSVPLQVIHPQRRKCLIRLADQSTDARKWPQTV